MSNQILYYMKRLLLFRRFLASFLLFAVTVSTHAWDACIDGIYYNFNGDEAEVTHPNDEDYEDYSISISGEIVIPKYVTYLGNKYRVTSIGYGAFDHCTSLTSVTIPNSVITIGGEAFENCEGLISVNIPNSVTSIGKEAFKRCLSLASIIIPNSVTNIEHDAFHRCISLTTVTIPGSVKSTNVSLFQECYGLISVVIENGVTSIGKTMFEDCTNLTSITIPASVTSIGRKAFANCYSLTSITIPYSVTEIGENAFAGCYFTENAFRNHSNLTDTENWGYKIYEQETSDGLLLNDNEVLVRCRPGVPSVSIPKTVTAIEDYAFKDCNNLTSITIPDNVKTIGEYAFYGCI